VAQPPPGPARHRILYSRVEVPTHPFHVGVRPPQCPSFAPRYIRSAVAPRFTQYQLPLPILLLTLPEDCTAFSQYLPPVHTSSQRVTSPQMASRPSRKTPINACAIQVCTCATVQLMLRSTHHWFLACSGSSPPALGSERQASLLLHAYYCSQLTPIPPERSPYSSCRSATLTYHIPHPVHLSNLCAALTRATKQRIPLMSYPCILSPGTVVTLSMWHSPHKRLSSNHSVVLSSNVPHSILKYVQPVPTYVLTFFAKKS
jgi:hypothetical protein